MEQGTVKWWQVQDVKPGMVLPKKSPYSGAKVIRVSRNGWARCKWFNGVEFSARVHWLTPTP